MIKRKIVIIFMAVYLIVTLSFFAYASLLSPFISKLAPAAALATGSGGGFTIPAKVVATTSTGANVAKWISLAVPGATAAKVAIAVAGVAGALAADYLMAKGAAWFLANNITKNDPAVTGLTGDFKETQTFNVPNGYTLANYYGIVGTGDFGLNVNGLGLYDNAAAALAAVQAAIPGKETTSGSGSKGCFYRNKHHTASNPSAWWYAWYTCGQATHTETKDVSISSQNMENKLAGDLANEDQNAKDLAKAALEVAANAMDNPNHPVAKNTNVYNNINNYLTQNITNNQLTNLEAAATPNVGDQVLPDTEEAKVETLTAAQIAAAVAAALANQGLSATQIAAAIAAAQSAASGGLTNAELAATLASNGLTAAQIAAAVAAAAPAALTQAQTKTAVKDGVKEAVDDETGITPPVDPVISLPDKLSLTTILNDFWTSVQALPIFNVLNGITITTSGSSNLCIDLPADYGGQRCYNAANVQDELNMIGSVILGLTTVVSFIGIFKG